MAKILIVGGGFAGLVAAESLVKKLGSDHEITLAARSRTFLFYPGLVRFAFGKYRLDDISFDLRDTLLDKRIRFVKGEIARIDLSQRRIAFAHGDFDGEMGYDFLVLAPGRRLATERITGFFEHADHLLGIEGAEKLGAAARSFHEGQAVIGHCPGARLPIPVFETAFFLSELLEQSGERDRCGITIVSGEKPDEMFGGAAVSKALHEVLDSRRINFISDFSIDRVTANAVIATDGRALECNLRMLVPPFRGPGTMLGTGFTDDEGYVLVDQTMRVSNIERTYAAGDCVNFPGPKLGHMSVRQAEVAAENLATEIEGREVSAVYDHEMMLVVDAAGEDSIFVRKDLWSDDPVDVKQGRFWSWAKRMQQRYWQAKHA